MESLDLECCGTKHKIRMDIGSYERGGNLAVSLISQDNKMVEPLCRLTVNIAGEVCSPNCTFIDTNNLPNEIIAWIATNKLATPTGRIAFSGYCISPPLGRL